MRFMYLILFSVNIESYGANVKRAMNILLLLIFDSYNFLVIHVLKIILYFKISIILRRVKNLYVTAR